MPTPTLLPDLDRSPEFARRAPSLSELLIQSETQAVSALWRGLQRLWTEGFVVSNPASFAFGVSLLWAAFYNTQFWRLTVDAMWHAGGGSLVFVTTLIVCVVTVQATLLLLLPSFRWMEIAAAALFVVAAVS